MLVKDVKDAVGKYVDLGTLEQLVLYFAGHGYLNGTSRNPWREIWGQVLQWRMADATLP